ELAVRQRFVGMRSKMIAHCKLVDHPESLLRAHIQVVRRKSFVVIERLSILDAEIATMTIAERREPIDRHCHVRSGRYHDCTVNDRFGGESRHRRTADMLYPERLIGNCGQDARTQQLE